MGRKEFIETEITDWDCEGRKEKGLPVDDYKLTVESDELGSENGVYITVRNPENNLYLQLRVEISNNLPTVRVWGDDGGDTLVHLTRDMDKLYITPEDLADVKPDENPSINNLDSYSIPAHRECPFCGELCFESGGCDEWNNSGYCEYAEIRTLDEAKKLTDTEIKTFLEKTGLDEEEALEVIKAHIELFSKIDGLDHLLSSYVTNKGIEGVVVDELKRRGIESSMMRYINREEFFEVEMLNIDFLRVGNIVFNN